MRFKALYANGCSVTEGCELGNLIFEYDESVHPYSNIIELKAINESKSIAHAKHINDHSWPVLAANQLGIPHVMNSAISGSGNQAIARRTIGELPYLLTTFKPHEILVVIGWSGLTRYEAHNCTNFTNRVFGSPYQPNTFDQQMIKYLDSREENIPNQLIPILYDFARTVLSLMFMLDNWGIKYIFSFGIVDQINEIWSQSLCQIAEQDQSLNQHLEAMKMDDWFLQGAFTEDRAIDRILYDVGQLSFSHFTSKNKYPRGTGWHPLEEAHKAWAQVFSKHISLRFN